MPKKNVNLIVITVLFLLCIPLIAMQFSDDINWDMTDFLIAALLLLVTGLIIELVVRKVSNTNYKLLVIAGIIILMILTFIEIGVGVFNTPLAGN